MMRVNKTLWAMVNEDGEILEFPEDSAISATKAGLARLCRVWRFVATTGYSPKQIRIVLVSEVLS